MGYLTPSEIEDLGIKPGDMIEVIGGGRRTVTYVTLNLLEDLAKDGFRPAGITKLAPTEASLRYKPA